MGVGRLDVLDDEELLAGLDEAEVAAREILDRGGILSQPAGLLAQTHVVGADVGERLLERPELLPLLEHLDEPLLADESVEQEHAPNEQDQILHDPTAAAPERLAARR